MTEILRILKYRGRTINSILEEPLDETDSFEFELSNGLYDLKVFDDSERLIRLLKTDLSEAQKLRVESALGEES
jgi:hypothetical protein